MPILYRPLPSKQASKQAVKRISYQQRAFPRFPRSPRAIKMILLFLAVVVLVNIIVARFSAQIQASLTLPTPTPPRGSITTPTNDITLSAQNILAQDTFDRPDQPGWGTSSDGQNWMADAATLQNFSIVNHQGQVKGGNAIFDAILGRASADSEIVFTGSLSHYGPSTLGAVLRWTDAKNLYKAELDGKNLVLLKKSAGTVTTLKTVPFPALSSVLYTLRFRATGAQLFVSAWPAALQQPTTWLISFTDTSLTTGYGGLRFFVQDDATAMITSFREANV